MTLPNHDVADGALTSTVVAAASADVPRTAAVAVTPRSPRAPHILDDFLPAIECEAEAVRAEAAKSATILLAGGVMVPAITDDIPRNACVYRFARTAAAGPGGIALTGGQRVIVVAGDGACVYRGQVRSADARPTKPRGHRSPCGTGLGAHHGAPSGVVEIVVFGTHGAPTLGTVRVARDSAAWMLDHLHVAISAVLDEPARYHWSRDFATAMLTSEGYRALPAPPALPRPSTLDWSASLNQEQLDVLGAVESQALVWVLAGPGTGKTKSAAALLRHMLDRDPAHRVLLVTPSNAAADAAVLALDRVFMRKPHQHWLTARGLIRRVGDGVTTALDAQHRSLYCLEETRARLTEETHLALDAARKLLAEAEATGHISDVQGLRQPVANLERELGTIGDQLAENHRITVAPISWVYLNGGYQRLEGFDLVVIDECGATDPAAAALAAGFAAHRVVAVGDPRQLGPIVTAADVGVQRCLGTSAMEHARVLEAIESGDQLTHAIALVEQFRMAPPIAALVSSLFYGGTLRTAPGRTTDYHRARAACWHPVPDAHGARIVVIDTSEVVRHPRFSTPADVKALAPFPARSTRSSAARSQADRSTRQRVRHAASRSHGPAGRSNVAHAALIADLLRAMGDDPRASDVDVALLSFYRDQVELLREAASWHNAHVTSGSIPGPRVALAATIHAMQGSERTLIILDAADRRGGPAPVFLQRDPDSIRRLLNVALSRAREFVVIVADLTVFASASPEARRIMHACVEAGCVLRARLPPAPVARYA